MPQEGLAGKKMCDFAVSTAMCRSQQGAAAAAASKDRVNKYLIFMDLIWYASMVARHRTCIISSVEDLHHVERKKKPDFEVGRRAVLVASVRWVCC